MTQDEVKRRAHYAMKCLYEGSLDNNQVEALQGYIDMMEYKEFRYIRKIEADQVRRNYMRDIIERVLQLKRMHDADILLGQLVGLLDILKQDLKGDSDYASTKMQDV